MFYWGISYRLIELRWDCLNLVHKSHLPNCDVFMYLKIIFTLTCLSNSVDPGEMQYLWYCIWVFNVCQSTHLGVNGPYSSIHCIARREGKKKSSFLQDQTESPGLAYSICICNQSWTLLFRIVPWVSPSKP